MVMQMMTIKTMMLMAMFVLGPCEPYFLYDSGYDADDESNPSLVLFACAHIL